MNLTSFLNKVDQTIEKYGREELLQVYMRLQEHCRKVNGQIS